MENGSHELGAGHESEIMLPQDQSDSGSRRIAAFRGHMPREGLSVFERIFLLTTCINLCFLPWALGTVLLRDQIISLVLAICGMTAALCSFRHRKVWMEIHPVPERPSWRYLAGFPPFWLGFGLLVYLLVQATNPSWEYIRNANWWWLVKCNNRFWLPTSVKTPFHQFNIWRQFIIYADAWLLTCSVWIGPTSRRSLRIILGVMVANAVSVSLLLVVQRLLGTTHFPWPLTEWTTRGLVGSFANRNYTGAYLALLTFPALGLTAWFADYKIKALKKSTPASVFALAALILAISVIFTLSRGATLMMIAATIPFGAWLYYFLRFSPTSTVMNLRLVVFVSALILLPLGATVSELNYRDIFDRMSDLAVQKTTEPSVRFRLMARNAALQMLKDNGVRGVGAGGFRFLFTEYARRYPEIYLDGTLFWEHAHCDWLEIPIELGICGDLLLVFGLGWYASLFLRRKVIGNPMVVPLIIGCVQTMGHAMFDFPFQCPAILSSWLVLLTVAAKWSVFTMRGQHAADRPPIQVEESNHGAFFRPKSTEIGLL